MVTRYSLGLPREILRKSSGFGIDKKYKPIYNAAPGHNLPVLLNDFQEGFISYQWGLLPYDTVDHSIGEKLINARLETLHVKKPFESLIKEKRCLIPADGFYCIDEKNGKYFRFFLPGNQLFFMAGLWDTWEDEYNPNNKLKFNSFSIITQDSEGVIAPQMDRMPVVLTTKTVKKWLNREKNVKKLRENLVDLPPLNWSIHKVPASISDPDFNDISLIRQPDQPLPGENLSLF